MVCGTEYALVSWAFFAHIDVLGVGKRRNEVASGANLHRVSGQSGLDAVSGFPKILNV